jgi:hypothetical protein
MKLMMLKNYFEEKKGIEILAAPDASGKRRRAYLLSSAYSGGRQHRCYYA